MKKSYLILPLIIMLYGGCSLKNGLLQKDKLYEKALIHSKEGAIYNSLELKASIIATHLNTFLEECKHCQSERFLVAIYIDNDSSDKKKQGYYNSYYTLTLNGKAPLSVKELSYDDDLIKIAPFRNPWAHYYLIDFARDDKPSLNLRYQSKSYGGTVLHFKKD